VPVGWIYVPVGWVYVPEYCEVGISEGEGSYFDHGRETTVAPGTGISSNVRSSDGLSLLLWECERNGSLATKASVLFLAGVLGPAAMTGC
jgi:hypothetical protein